jgi:RimJ/RimL family protein N-acetyltransferase
MHTRSNALGQAIGVEVTGWKPVPRPPRNAMEGRFCRVEPLDPARHAPALFDAFAEDREQRIWTYLPYGPFHSLADLETWMRESCMGDDPLFHAIVECGTGAAVGVASYLRINPSAGVIEVGHINYSPRLQRTPAATEAMFLMMARVFDGLGYRRYEWKCDALNAGSCRAAERLGFTFEGVFRQATMYKGRNRDTAWYSVIDREWPSRKAAFEDWLGPANFDPAGQQRASLASLVDRHRGEDA